MMTVLLQEEKQGTGTINAGALKSSHKFWLKRHQTDHHSGQFPQKRIKHPKIGVTPNFTHQLN